VDYTRLSLGDVATLLADVARDTQSTFGDLDVRQLNWRPDPTRWSIAQCFEHLLIANRFVHQAALEALNPSSVRTLWQQLPVLPGVFGRLLIRSQAPTATRKYTAAPAAQPTSSDIAPDILQRFIEQHREAVLWVQSLDERAATTIMTSPFVRMITYSVLDGCRLIVAHDHRHFEQARRVMHSPGFPNISQGSTIPGRRAAIQE
jgi:hypothetical protein